MASGKIAFEDVKKLDVKKSKHFEYKRPEFKNDTIIRKAILDLNHGSVLMNIDRKNASKIGLNQGKKYDILITDGTKKTFIKNVVYDNAFGNVQEREPVLYFNSLGYLSVGLNVGNFAKTHGVKYGSNWKIIVSKAE